MKIYFEHTFLDTSRSLDPTSNRSYCVIGGELHAFLPERIPHGPECCAAGPSYRLGDRSRVVAAAA